MGSELQSDSVLRAQVVADLLKQKIECDHSVLPRAITVATLYLAMTAFLMKYALDDELQSSGRQILALFGLASTTIAVMMPYYAEKFRRDAARDVAELIELLGLPVRPEAFLFLGVFSRGMYVFLGSAALAWLGVAAYLFYI